MCGLYPLISPRLDCFQNFYPFLFKRLCSSATVSILFVLFACSQDNKPILWKSSMKDFLIAVSSRGETHERKIEPAFTMWQDHWPQGYLQLGGGNEFSSRSGSGFLNSNLTVRIFFPNGLQLVKNHHRTQNFFSTGDFFFGFLSLWANEIRYKYYACFP